jgi:hypothetical protein
VNRRRRRLLELACLSVALLGCGQTSDQSPYATQCRQKMERLGFKDNTPVGRAEIANCEDVLASANSVQATPGGVNPDSGGAGLTGAGDTTADDTEAETTTPTVPATSVDELANRYRFKLTQAGGYQFSGQLLFGEPQHVADVAVTDGSQTLVAAEGCGDLDSDADAAIPAAMTVTNETSGFAGKAVIYLTGNVDRTRPTGLMVEPSFLISDGPSCQDPYSGSTGYTTANLQPGQHGTTLVMLYVKRFYLPDHPTGDVAGLKALPLFFGNGTNVLKLTRIAGPKPITNGSQAYLVPLV